jgi:alpha-amylase
MTLMTERSHFRDTSGLGTFIDNHDNERFLHIQSDYKKYMNALAFVLFTRGVPIIYYGTEQGFSGGNDPYCREPLWNNFKRDHMLYKYLATLVNFRNKVISQIVLTAHVERYVTDNFYVCCAIL